MVEYLFGFIERSTNVNRCFLRRAVFVAAAQVRLPFDMGTESAKLVGEKLH